MHSTPQERKPTEPRLLPLGRVEGGAWAGLTPVPLQEGDCGALGLGQATLGLCKVADGTVPVMGAGQRGGRGHCGGGRGVGGRCCGGSLQPP